MYHFSKVPTHEDHSRVTSRYQALAATSITTLQMPTSDPILGHYSKAPSRLVLRTEGIPRISENKIRVPRAHEIYAHVKFMISQAVGVANKSHVAVMKHIAKQTR